MQQVADGPVDAPHRQLDLELRKRFVPRGDVLVDEVDEGAVEVEQQRGQPVTWSCAGRCAGRMSRVP